MAAPPPLPWALLLAAIVLATVQCSEINRNPRVLRLVFRNDSASAPDRLVARTAARSDIPLVYCRDASYPDDVYCDIGMLLDRDVFPSNMMVFGVNTAMRDPVRTGKFCSVEFLNTDENDVNPIPFKEIECGRDREIISEDSLNAPEGIDSMAVLPRFQVAKMTDFVLTSYSSGFGCKHRLKRTSKKGRGSLFKLNSFFCSIGFGIAEGRPETPYPPQIYYKHDGKRWRPVGNWPDYL